MANKFLLNKKEGFLKEKVQTVSGQIEWDDRFFSLDFAKKRLVISMTTSDGGTKAERLKASDLSLVNLWVGADTVPKNQTMSEQNHCFDLLMTNGTLRSLQGDSVDVCKKWCQAIEQFIQNDAILSNNDSLAGNNNSKSTNARATKYPPFSASSKIGAPLSSFTSSSYVPTMGPPGSTHNTHFSLPPTGENHLWQHISQLSQRVKALTFSQNKRSDLSTGHWHQRQKHSYRNGDGDDSTLASRVGQADGSIVETRSLPEVASHAASAQECSFSSHVLQNHPDNNHQYQKQTVGNDTNTLASASLVDQLNTSLHEMQVATRKAEISAQRHGESPSDTDSEYDSSVHDSSGTRANTSASKNSKSDSSWTNSDSSSVSESTYENERHSHQKNSSESMLSVNSRTKHKRVNQSLMNTSLQTSRSSRHAEGRINDVKKGKNIKNHVSKPPRHTTSQRNYQSRKSKQSEENEEEEEELEKIPQRKVSDRTLSHIKNKKRKKKSKTKTKRDKKHRNRTKKDAVLAIIGGKVHTIEPREKHTVLQRGSNSRQRYHIRGHSHNHRQNHSRSHRIRGHTLPDWSESSIPSAGSTTADDKLQRHKHSYKHTNSGEPQQDDDQTYSHHILSESGNRETSLQAHDEHVADLLSHSANIKNMTSRDTTVNNNPKKIKPIGVSTTVADILTNTVPPAAAASSSVNYGPNEASSSEAASQATNATITVGDATTLAQNAKIDWLRNQLQQKEAQVVSMHTILDKVERALESERARHKAVTQANMTDLQQLQLMHKQQVAQLQTKLQEVHGMQKCISQKSHNQQTSYEKTMEDFQQKIANLQQQIKHHEESLLVERSKTTDALEQVSTASTQKKNMASEITELQSQLQQAKREVVRWRNEHGALRKELSRYERLIYGTKAIITERRAQAAMMMHKEKQKYIAGHHHRSDNGRRTVRNPKKNRKSITTSATRRMMVNISDATMHDNSTGGKRGRGGGDRLRH